MPLARTNRTNSNVLRNSLHLAEALWSGRFGPTKGPPNVECFRSRT
jgi:hypothetical protein